MLETEYTGSLSRHSISRHGISDVGQTTCIVVPELISSTGMGSSQTLALIQNVNISFVIFKFNP